MYNPEVYGHTGDVYLNGVPFYEADSLDRSEESGCPRERICLRFTEGRKDSSSGTNGLPVVL